MRRAVSIVKHHNGIYDTRKSCLKAQGKSVSCIPEVEQNIVYREGGQNRAKNALVRETKIITQSVLPSILIKILT